MDGGNGVDLGNSLEKHRPRYLLFIGHADAKHRYTRELTLGLTDEKGGIVRLNVDTLVDTFVAANLDLVVINGCESEALGAKIAARGGIPVVCWRTKALDAAAACVPFSCHPGRFPSHLTPHPLS